jgi:hypothetical protein
MASRAQCAGENSTIAGPGGLHHQPQQADTSASERISSRNLCEIIGRIEPWRTPGHLSNIAAGRGARRAVAADDVVS